MKICIDLDNLINLGYILAKCEERSAICKKAFKPLYKYQCNNNYSNTLTNDKNRKINP